MTSQVHVESQDPGLVQQVGSSLLHGISNVISVASIGAQVEEMYSGSGKDEENRANEKKIEYREKVMEQFVLREKGKRPAWFSRFTIGVNPVQIVPIEKKFLKSTMIVNQ